MLPDEQLHIASFIDQAVTRVCAKGRGPETRVLDFGCGRGELMQSLASLGYDVSGCDVAPFWGDRLMTGDCRVIERDPYRLPFDDRSFDVVVSTSVLEHAQNKREVFREIHRVLNPGGAALHLYPSKWYLPIEPHIFVPLVNVFWPRCPRWWLAAWAWLGVRNSFQQGLDWRAVTDLNLQYCADGLSYWSHRRYRQLSMEVFGNYEDATTFFVQHGYGGLARLLRRLPLPQWLAGACSSYLRMSLMINRRQMAPM